MNWAKRPAGNLSCLEGQQAQEEGPVAVQDTGGAMMKCRAQEAGRVPVAGHRQGKHRRLDACGGSLGPGAEGIKTYIMGRHKQPAAVPPQETSCRATAERRQLSASKGRRLLVEQGQAAG